jgi:hypothetical protein
MPDSHSHDGQLSGAMRHSSDAANHAEAGVPGARSVWLTPDLRKRPLASFALLGGGEFGDGEDLTSVDVC